MRLHRRDSPLQSLAIDWWPRRRGDVVLFAALAFATAAFARDFAWTHLQIHTAWPFVRIFARPNSDSFAVESATAGLPIFVTELALALLLLLIARRRWKSPTARGTGNVWLDRSLLLWGLVGLCDLARGLNGGITLALRDFAIVYYATFLYLARAVGDRWRHLRAIGLAFWLGTLVSLTAATLQYVDPALLPPGSWPSRGDFLEGSYGVYFMVAIAVGMALWPRCGRTGQWILFVYLSVAAFALVLPQQRSLILAFAVGSSALLVARAAGAAATLPPWRMAAGAALAGLLLEIARFGVGGSAQFVDPVRQLISKTGQTVVVTKTVTDDGHTAAAGGATAPSASAPEDSQPELTGTARFRQDAWREAWGRFLAQPMLGEGFGRPFVFYDRAQRRWWTDDVRPHNAFLTVLYKMGILGMAALTLVHFAFYREARVGLRRAHPPMVRAAIWGLMTALVGMQVYACFNLLFESPFLAVVYWSVMGLIGALLHLEESSAASCSTNQ